VTIRPETSQNSFSKPSSPLVSLNLPRVNNLKTDFTYNYYVPDERTNESPSIPDYLKRRTSEQTSIDTRDLTVKSPRYVRLTWDVPKIVLTNGPNSTPGVGLTIAENLEKIQTEETFVASKFTSCDVTDIETVADAAAEVHSLGQAYSSINFSNGGWPQNIDTEDIGTRDIRNGINTAKTITNNSQYTSVGVDGKTRTFFANGSFRDQKVNVMFPNSIVEARKAGAFQVAGSPSRGFSLGNMIDVYNNNTLKSYSENTTQLSVSTVRFGVAKTVKNVEVFADSNLKNFGFSLHTDDGKMIAGNSGYEKLRLTANENRLNLHLNHLTGIDVFASSSLSRLNLSMVNKNYVNASKQSVEIDDVTTQPAYVGPIVQNPDAFETSANLVGYVIQRSIRTGDGFQYEKTFTIENASTGEFVDTSILFGKIYSYAIRSVLRVDTTGFDDEASDVRQMSYFIGSKSSDAVVNTTEYVPPPPPVDLNFIWDYKHKKLQVVWGMPPNVQRDITQFQVLRRSRLEEPFELISQKCFDFSTKKYKTGEQVDGNVPNLPPEIVSLIEYSEQPRMFHVDDDFVVDSASLRSSKYIYTIASIDAHGMISNYGSQFEVTFDFFKNVLKKKLVSNAGAPRPYPNMYVKIDAFKDVIKTSGWSSTKMQVYFMPEYFKLVDKDKRVQRMVATKQSNSYYKLQFINIQNQKSDALKISIDDPLELATSIELPQ
jgi:hypothetical protein